MSWQTTTSSTTTTTVKPSPAQTALKLMDQRRIRRQKLIGRYDLNEDVTEQEEKFLAKEEKEKEEKAKKQKYSKYVSSSSKKKSDAANVDPQEDFRLFGRMLPRGTNPNTRMYLLERFPVLEKVIDIEKEKEEEQQKLEEEEKKQKLLQSHHHPQKQQNQTTTTTGANQQQQQQHVPAISKRMSRAEFNRFTTEQIKHRRLFEAALGELGAGLAVSSANSGKFRQLIRSEAADVEERERKLIQRRETLPLCISAETKFICGGFEDRPPSPRTVEMQKRRIRLAMCMKESSVYSYFLDPIRNLNYMPFFFQHLFRRASLTPTSSFFGMNFASGSDNDNDDDGNNNNNNKNKNNRERGVELIITPESLLYNIQNLPNKALSEQDVDYLMLLLAPKYQEVIESNKEAEKKKENKSLLLKLALTRKETVGAAALDGDLQRLLKKYEEDTKTKEIDSTAVTVESSLRRILRAVSPNEPGGGDDGGNFDENNNNNNEETFSEQKCLGLLCYAALLPKALRRSVGVINASASSPPPAISKEFLTLAEAEYIAESENEMAGVIRRFSESWHPHFAHLCLGHDVPYCCNILASPEEHQQHFITQQQQSFQQRFIAEEEKRVLNEIEDGTYFSEKENNNNNKKNNNKNTKEQQRRQSIISEGVVQNHSQPSPFPQKILDLVGFTPESSENEDCSICYCTGVGDSNYAFIDSNMLNSIRDNTGNPQFVSTFEKKILNSIYQRMFPGQQQNNSQNNTSNKNKNTSSSSSLMSVGDPLILMSLASTSAKTKVKEELDAKMLMLEFGNKSSNKKKRRKSSSAAAARSASSGRGEGSGGDASSGGENEKDDIVGGKSARGGRSTSSPNKQNKKETAASKRKKIEKELEMQQLKKKVEQELILQFAAGTNNNNNDASSSEQQQGEKWRADFLLLPQDLEDFAKGSETATKATLDHRYFEIFMLHFAQSPMFGGMFCGSLILKQFVNLARNKM